MSSSFTPENSINGLPENLLLDIFRWLPIKDLCTIGRVCRKWRRIISDNSLWRRVDLRPYKLNLHKMWKVIRAHFSEVLLSLHLRGYTDPASINWKKHSLSDAMLKDLQDRCPNIAELELVWTSLQGVSVTGLPHHLQRLTVTDSLIPTGWFHGAATCKFKATLTELDLSRSTKTTNADLRDICEFAELRRLNVNFCYRISEPGLKDLADNLAKLEVLEVAETRCTDLALHHIGRGISGLRRLNISGCESVTDAGLASIAACLKELEVLHLLRCDKITDRGLDHLAKAKSLRECDVTRTKVTAEGVTKLRAVLDDKCDVIAAE